MLLKLKDQDFSICIVNLQSIGIGTIKDITAEKLYIFKIIC
jgi:hypothetical protein